mmetsp:Transcript_35115/g.98088  ORF Transcript_35115/g.98088 Transcript_35115/m.98088 type:complete len:260 (+) Transcript_35115:187-966(+)
MRRSMAFVPSGPRISATNSAATLRACFQRLKHRARHNDCWGVSVRTPRQASPPSSLWREAAALHCSKSLRISLSAGISRAASRRSVRASAKSFFCAFAWPLRKSSLARRASASLPPCCWYFLARSMPKSAERTALYASPRFRKITLKLLMTGSNAFNTSCFSSSDCSIDLACEKSMQCKAPKANIIAEVKSDAWYFRFPFSRKSAARARRSWKPSGLGCPCLTSQSNTCLHSASRQKCRSNRSSSMSTIWAAIGTSRNR